jgi:hypothetical protein
MAYGWSSRSERMVVLNFSCSLLKKAVACAALMGASRREALRLILARFSGLEIHSFNASVSRSAIGSGVPGGANSADQMLYSKFLILVLSLMVGTSGRAGLRFSLASAIALTLPDWISSRVDPPSGAKVRSRCWPIISDSAGAPPL